MKQITLDINMGRAAGRRRIRFGLTPGAPWRRTFRSVGRGSCRGFRGGWSRAIRVSAIGVVAAALAMAVASVATASTRADGDPGVADLRLAGTVDPVQAAVGNSLTWQITVNDYNTGPALDVWIDVTLPTNVELTSSYTDRGTGCTPTGTNTLHCDLDWLADTAQFAHVILVTKVTATGDHVLTAVTGYRAADPNPADNTLTLAATTPTPPPPIAPVLPVISTAVVWPPPTAGKRATVSFLVLRSDTNNPLTEGTMIATSLLAGKTIAHKQQFRGGVAQISLVVPKTAKGKTLTVKLTITSSGGSATKTATLPVR